MSILYNLPFGQLTLSVLVFKFLHIYWLYYSQHIRHCNEKILSKFFIFFLIFSGCVWNVDYVTVYLLKKLWFTYISVLIAGLGSRGL